MATRRDFLYTGALVAPGLMLAEPLLHALIGRPGELPATPLEGRQEWSRNRPRD